jgi:hypothetical protein
MLLGFGTEAVKRLEHADIPGGPNGTLAEDIPLSVDRRIVIACDERVAILCAEMVPTIVARTVSHHLVEDARAAAHARGWVTIGRAKNLRDVCPECRQAILHRERRRKMTQATSERKEMSL